MTENVYATVNDCKQFANGGALMHHQRDLTLLPMIDALELITVNILRPFNRVKHENRFVVIIADRW